MTNEMLCPSCQADTPSTEVFEVFGLFLCAECATALYDPGDGLPTTESASNSVGIGAADEPKTPGETT